ncbi:hypothetical protein [Chitinophaga sp. XS-30]|uniref:hypothetical protein n=1 Tax=Chitinophaga sp. XS-30 TaxID=2604421 RepID=UPI00143DAC78|nr:hypothetical protein [Chitinophaga sp. XS-30]
MLSGEKYADTAASCSGNPYTFIAASRTLPIFLRAGLEMLTGSCTPAFARN